MDRRTACLSLASAGLLAAAPMRARAARTARVGWVTFSPDPKVSPRQSAIDGFREGLRERGWIEGNNLLLDLRVGDRTDAPVIAKAFVDGGADVIYTDGAMVNGLKTRSGETPIVFSMSGDPVEAKWVASFARPGGTVTGMTSLHLELEPKRLELLKEINPGLKRVAVLGNELHPGYQSQLKASQIAAQQFALALESFPVRTSADFEKAFAAMAQGRVEAVVVFSDSLVNLDSNARAIAAFAERLRIPSVSAWPSFAEAGNLLSYGPNEREFFRRISSYIDRILRGAKPADLPVELPSRFEMAVNRQTAKRAGITLPRSIIVRADRVIE